MSFLMKKLLKTATTFKEKSLKAEEAEIGWEPCVIFRTNAVKKKKIFRRMEISI